MTAANLDTPVSPGAALRAVPQRLLSSWRLKALAQRSLARLPAPLGDPLYHRLQHLRGLAPEASSHRAFVSQALAHVEAIGGPEVQGRDVVEIGSGWFPLTPLLLLARGVRSVHTFDANRHYSPNRIRGAAEALEADLSGVSDLEPARTGRLPARLHYHPKTRLEAACLQPRSIRLAVSKFVLEHVAPRDLVEVHRASTRWLADDGLWVHWVSPGDHRSYSDRRLTGFDFLRYSEPQWRSLCGNRYAYHNRLRLPQYRALFAEAGFEVVRESASVRAEDVAAVERFPVHPDFAGLAPRDLVAGSLWFVLRRAA